MFNRNELYNGAFPMATSKGRTRTHGVNMTKKILLERHNPCQLLSS